MNEYNPVRRRHPSVKIADLKVDSPVFFPGTHRGTGCEALDNWTLSCRTWDVAP